MCANPEVMEKEAFRVKIQTRGKDIDQGIQATQAKEVRNEILRPANGTRCLGQLDHLRQNIQIGDLCEQIKSPKQIG